MTRAEAEKIALEMYPVAEQTFKSNIGDFYTTYDVNERPRKAFMEAYQIFLNDNASAVKKAAEDAAEYAKRRALKNCPKWKRAERAIDSDCIDYARSAGKRVVEPTADFEDRWVRHHDETAAATLVVKTDSWYMGSNVDGKPRRLLSYIGGAGTYHRQCDDLAAGGYPGFRMT